MKNLILILPLILALLLPGAVLAAGMGQSAGFDLDQLWARAQKQHDLQREDAVLFRRKCKVLVAYGSCACFGGIPGLANLSNREQVFEVAYASTPSTENPEGLRPETEWRVNGHRLTLPAHPVMPYKTEPKQLLRC